MKKTTSALVVSGLKLDKSLESRLKERVEGRKEELILDLLEQIEIHKVEIKKLVAKINKISSESYIYDDEDL